MYHSKKQVILSSLLSVFLVGTLVITSTLMSNPNFSLDIRNYAKEQLEPEEEAFLKKFTKDSVKTSNVDNPPANNSNSQPRERIQRDDEIKDDPSAPTAVAPAAPAIIIAPSDREEIEAEKALMRANQNPAPPVVAPPPATIKTDEQIEQELMEKRQRTVAQTTAQTATTPIITPTTSNASTPTTTTRTTNNQGLNIQIKECRLDKGTWDSSQNECKYPSPITTTTPPATINNITSTGDPEEDCYISTNGKGTFKNGRCSSGATALPPSTIIPTTTPTNTQPTSTPERLTKLYTDKNCGGLKSGESCVLVQGTGQYGIVTNSSATAISYNSGATAGTPTSTSIIPISRLRSDGTGCVDDSECESGTCQASVDGRICKYRNPAAGFAAGFSQNIKETTQNYSGENLVEDLTMFGPSLIAGILTLNPQASLATQQMMTKLPSWTQTAASVATLAEGPLAIITCQTQGTNSPACQMAAMGLTTGFFSDPVGTLQGLQGSVQQVQNVTENLLDNTVFSGLTGDPYWGGGFSNSSGQTLLSRSNMPANLTPQEQSLWLSKADIVENWNYYQTYGPPSRWTNVGYQPNAAAELYQPSNINEALDNVPDPLGIINNLEQQSSLGATPAEILANSRSYIESNGIIILETPPPTEQWWVSTPDGQGLSWSDGLSQPLSNSPTFGIYSGKDDGIAISVEGTKFAFPSDYSSFPLPYKPYDGDAILLNRQALDELGPSKELQTTIHEAGHAVESSYTPQVTSNFWYKNQETEKWMVSQETAAAATEYISTLYGIKAAQALAPTNINMAIDNMINQLLLNTNIINPNPSYLLNN